MKKILLIALTAFASAVHAGAATQSMTLQNTTATIDSAASDFTAPDGQKMRLLNESGSVSRSTVSSTAQVLYEVTLEEDGKLARSISILTNDGMPGVTAIDEARPYVSCTSASDCKTVEFRTGFVLSLTPRIGGTGSILTSCSIDLSKLLSVDSVPQDGFVTQRPHILQITNAPTFSLSSGQTLVMPLDGRFKLTIKATIV